MIQLESVSKVFDDGFEALKSINLTFDEGQINVLIGPSGCGKSTTMKLLNRLIDHSSGQITIDNEDISSLDAIELRRKMGYVIQNIGLFPHMTIYDNVATVPKLLKWDKERIRKRVIELLEMVNLDPETYMKRYPSELSGGQQQRIGVIRALAAEPSTILMDEPFSALDPISREQLQDELIRLQKEIKKTIIFVTHDMDEAIKIANQIILMKDGQVVQKGTPEEILENPVNEFVEQFIGPERLMQGRSLPELKDVTDTDFPIISSEDTSVQQAIEKMTSDNLSYLPVVSKSDSFEGVISLYDAISEADGKVKDLLKKDYYVDANSNFLDVSALLEKPEVTILPVVSNEGKFIGVVNEHRFIQQLNYFSGSKRGGQ